MGEMLDNIKLLLGLTDDKYDNLVTLYVNKVTYSVKDYCNVNELSYGLKSFVEDKVIEIMEPMVKKQVTGGVKSVTRGDTKIEYSTSTNKSIGPTLTYNDKVILNQYCVVKLC